MSLYRRLRTRAARAGFHRPVAWLRNLGLEDSDVMLASHGRSGSTLLRFVLAEILSGVPSSFDTIQGIIPEVGLQVDTLPTLPNHGRLIKTHEPYCGQYKRAIYMVRDVRDVILSSFARESAVGCVNNDLDDFTRLFMQGKISHWGSWQSHVESWANSALARNGDLLLLRFEDLRRDVEGFVRVCLQFLGRPAESSVILSAIQNNSLQKMRTKEQQSQRMMKIPGDGCQVNSGTVERWRTAMSEKQLRIVDDYAADVLERFGYSRGIGEECATRAPARQWEFQRVESRSIPVKENLQQVSAIEFAGQRHAALDRTLRARWGGRIANLFSWYAY
jgi:Sulfotransferase domain